jgi:hypothetical protein
LRGSAEAISLPLVSRPFDVNAFALVGLFFLPRAALAIGLIVDGSASCRKVVTA